MANTFNCPSCGAPLELTGYGELIRCPYCNNNVIVPPELRGKKSSQRTQTEPSEAKIPEDQLAEIKQLLREGNKIGAIKIYRLATNAGLKEAKDAVEAIQAADPELQKVSQKTLEKGSKVGVIVFGLIFLGIASIFPVVFFPMSVSSWQAQQYGAAFFSALGAVIWAVIWGGIGILILFSLKS